MSKCLQMITPNKFEFISKLSKVIDDRLYFGGYPSKQLFEWMMQDKFTHFIDLTTDHERNLLQFRYDKDMTFEGNQPVIINLPIRDNSIPCDNDLFKTLLRDTYEILKKKDTKIYVHCKGGHGRSGMMIACLLVYMFDIPSNKSLGLTTLFHSERVHTREKWKYAKCPQTYKQRKYVYEFVKCDKNPISVGERDTVVTI